MDLNDFTSAENKKMTTENDIPTFNPPIGDAPKVGVDGKSKKAQTFTPPTTSNMDPGCYYHPEERVVGHCARCGKNLCRYCCDSFGVTGGEYAGKMLCYDCTTKLVKDNVEELQKNHNYIHGQYTQCLVGCAIGGVIGFIWGLSGGIMGALLYMVLCAAIGGSASNFFHRFIAAIPGFFVSTGNMVISICVGLFKFIFCFFLYAIMALFETVKKILYYRNYMAQTADCLEKDSSALQCIRDRMEYSRVMNENRGMSLADLMNEGSELYNNSYARMVQEQGEEKAEAFVSRCTTQIAENARSSAALQPDRLARTKNTVAPNDLFQQEVNTVWITMMWSLHVVVHCRKQFIAVKPLWSRPRVRFSCRANRMILPVREFRSRRVSLLKAGGSNNGILLVSE